MIACPPLVLLPCLGGAIVPRAWEASRQQAHGSQRGDAIGARRLTGCDRNSEASLRMAGGQVALQEQGGAAGICERWLAAQQSQCLYITAFRNGGRTS